ncbi:MAG TPA: acyltransferase domain-containing protein, partial [Vicinamibacteria bacterium]|nr:acyltransferase domain-containing protein [Vicinamibacteria bacterium]
RGIGGASDGKGKGITAPNPVGQRLAIERAWKSAGLDPWTCSLVEGHGTSTRVGDVVEFESLAAAFGNGGGHAPQKVPLGSVKSNIGHLKGAAGAAGILKAVFALHHNRMPPSLHFDAPNPNIDFAKAPFYVNTRLQEWPLPACGVRRAGVSAFGFGGTNFHTVLEEHVPGRLTGDRRSHVGVSRPESPEAGPGLASLKAPLRGALVIGATSVEALTARLRQIGERARAGEAPEPAPPDAADLAAPERIAIDYANAGELVQKVEKAQKALAVDQPPVWKALRAQGVFRGRGDAPKVAFLFTGQGSQYVNMLRGLRDSEPIVRETFLEADRVMTPLLGRPLSDYIFVDPADPAALATAEDSLKQTAITQPAVLATDLALTRLLEAYGLRPDMVMGHSLGEYGALVAAGVLPLADALLAVSARGREMSRVSVEDNGKMAAVMAPLAEVERILATVAGYVVVANYNSASQAVIGGASAVVDEAVAAFKRAGLNAVPLPVSHAFHTRIVAPASGPLRQVLERLDVRPPVLPVVANVTGELYPEGPTARPEILEILSQQVASPVQFVKGLRTLRAAGVRVFVEVGPKKALHGFVEDAFADDPEVVALFTNHPKLADAAAFNQALCGLFAAGLGGARPPLVEEDQEMNAAKARPAAGPGTVAPAPPPSPSPLPPNAYQEIGHLFADFLERGLEIYARGRGPASVATEPVVITGAGLGLPGVPRVFDDANVARILRGEQLIAAVPDALREAMARKHILRLVKSEEGEHRFEHIASVSDVIKLAGRGGALDLEKEFGVSAERVAALDTVTKLAIGAGLEALHDAGLPLVLRYKTTTMGTQLPDRWMLPEALRDDTGVIFASAFPGLDSFADVICGYERDRSRRERLAELEDLRTRASSAGNGVFLAELDRRIEDLRALLARDAFVFDRRFLLRVLSMGHSQFAEHIGARGPNTQVNAACASTTQAVGLAEDWIRAGRCRRVVVISADDATSDHLMEWLGSGFLASGAAATDERVEEAALPFDRRRHGLIVGMGAAALVVESAEAARERGLLPICEVLSAVTANSAYHGTRLDVNHISQVMETLVAQAESRWGVKRGLIAPETVFVSHETYTPARGGSASAEIHALRRVFGDAADRIVMANTKGFTGHAMAVGIEDVVAVKSLETGLVPPVPNFHEVDPSLGSLNLSRGGVYPVRYALR